MSNRETEPRQVIARGVIRGPEAGGSVTLETSDQGAVLRLEDYWIAQGAPDVRVYLTPDRDGRVEVEGSLDFGKVTSFSGSLSYAVPAGARTRKMSAVVVYCKVFSVTFGVAPLERVG